MACTIPMSFFTFKKLHHAMILVFAVFFISLSHTSDYSSEVCGTWKRFKQSCYIRSFQPVTRAQADEACRRLGSELVEISDNEEQEFVYRNLVDVPRPVGVWTGLIRSAETDEWSWNNRTAPTFFYWGYGEPNNYMSRGENCSEMRYWDGMWNDVLCVNKYGYVCEKAIFVTQAGVFSSNIERLGMALQGHLISTIKVNDLMQCFDSCQSMSSCLSINFQYSRKEGTCVCELNNSTRGLRPSEFHRRQGFCYYD